MAWDALSTAFNSSNKWFIGTMYQLIFWLATFWLDLVSKIVPEPYLVISLLSLSDLLLTFKNRMRSSTYLKHRPTVQEISTFGILNSLPLLDCKCPASFDDAC